MKMNIDNQGLLHVRSGFIPPDDILARIIAAKPTVYGACVQASDGDKFSLDLYHEDAMNLGIDDLKRPLEAAKDFPITMYFGAGIDGTNKDNIQPLPVTDADGNNFIALFVEGTLNNIDGDNATEQSLFIQDVLMGKVVEYCNDFDGEIDKILTKLNSANFKKDLIPYLGHRAVIHMIPYSGEPVTLEHNNQIGINADWGFFSNSLLIPEIKKEEPKVEAPKAAGGSRFFGGNKTKASVPAVAPPAPGGTPEPAKVEDPKPADVATPGNVNKEVTGTATTISVRPPSWLKTNDDVRNWYTAVLGSVPQNAKKRIPALVEPSHPVLQFNSVDQLNKHRAEQRKKALQSSTAAPASAPKVEASGNGDNLPVLNAIEMNTVLDFVAKHLDGKGREITDPRTMKDVEKQLATFSASVGVEPHEILNWPVSGLFGLAKTEPRAMVLLAVEMRNLWRAELEAQGKLKDLIGPKSETKVETKTEDLGNGSTKTESVAKGPSRFFGGNKKVG